MIARSSMYWELGSKTLRGITVAAVFLLISHAGCSQNNLGVQVSELFERLDKTENELSEAKAMLTEKEAKLSAAEEKLREAEAKIREEKAKPNALKEPYREAMDKISRLTQEVDKKSEQIKVLTAELKVFQDAVTASRQSFDIWGVWTWFNGSYRVAILKPVGQEDTVATDAIVKIQAHRVRNYGFGRGPEDVWEDLALSCRVSELSGDRVEISVGDDGFRIYMQFLDNDHGLIWPNKSRSPNASYNPLFSGPRIENWPTDEFGQRVKKEFRRANK